jgi:K+-transporting ATPase KdpF subunit
MAANGCEREARVIADPIGLILGALNVVGLFGYLGYALLHPDRF